MDSYSRFKRTDIVDANGKRSFGLVSGFPFLDPVKLSPSQIENFVVLDRHRYNPARISQEYYGDPIYYWVVILFNKPRNVFMWPEPGTVISLPIPSVVIPEL